MWIAISIVLGLIGLVVLIAIVGLCLPERHICSLRATYKQSPQTLWDTIKDIDNFPSWRKDVSKVERLPDRDGRIVHREHCGGMAITMEEMEAVSGKRLVGRICDPKLPFGGGWTYELQPLDGGTQLTITETGIVRNPIFRVVSRFLMGHDATLKKYLVFLGQKFGEQVTPEATTEANPADWSVVLLNS